MMSPKAWIAATIALCAIGVHSPARADDKNEVRAVTFEDDHGITRVHVRGAQTPTFSVYKLDKPARVVVDLPQARLADALRGHEGASVWTPSTWAVSTIAAQQADDGAVRVIVTLARPGRYDIQQNGNEVIVVVTPRDPAPAVANPEDLARAKADGEAAKQAARAAQAESEAAKQVATSAQAETMVARQAATSAKAETEAAQQTARAAQAEAERLRSVAADQAARAETASRELVDAKQRAAKNTVTAQDLARAQGDAAKANDDARAAKQAAIAAQAEADRTRDAAQHAKQADADELARAKADTERARADATAARQEAESAKHQVVQLGESERAARADATSARAEATVAKRDAEHARQDAEAARKMAARDQQQAETDKHAAEVARAQAEKLIADTKDKLAGLGQQESHAQELQDKARAAHAAAVAREEAARDVEARARHDREAAELAVKQAQDARDRAAASDHERFAREAADAEATLTAARHATADAETRRQAAEQAATTAQHALEQTKTALASVEQQRTTAEAAATDAARKKSDAEAAAGDAVRRRGEAEQAAHVAVEQRAAAETAAHEASVRRSEAERQRSEAETARIAAERAARTAEDAKVAADKQRMVAEAAASVAVTAKHDAEASLGELTARRSAAEHAASELDARMKAEAKAQAEVAVVQARKAGEAEVATARAEVTKLADQRARAESELADRRKSVADQEARAAKLATAAAQAKDAADREEDRRSKLAQERQTEEQQLAELARRKSALAAATPSPAPPAPTPTVIKASVATPTAVTPIARAPTTPTNAASTPAPAKSEPTAKATAVAKVQNVSFRGDQSSALVDLAVVGDADVKLGEVTAQHVEVLVDHAELAPKLERTLDVSKFGSPIRTVSSFRDRRHADRVRLVIELARPGSPTLDHDASGVRLRVAAKDSPAQTARATVTDVPSPIVGGFAAASTPIAQQSISQVPPPPNTRRRIYHGATVDFDFKDAPLHELMRFIAQVGHVNIVVPDTTGEVKVTVLLKNVPWDQALEVILASHGLWYRREGNLYRIAPRKDLDAEDEAEAARRDAAIKSEAPKSEVLTLNYAAAADLKKKLGSMLSPKGSMEVDDRTNALIIHDVAGNREQIARLAYALDTQTPEITVEARIVEASSDFTRQIGIQWGGNGQASAQGGNATGLIFPSSVQVAGGNFDSNTNSNGVALNPSDFAVNLPATVGTGEGGALGVTLGSIAGNFNLGFRLSALEDTGTVRIISAPKVTVLNNKEAYIKQGVSIPISVVSAAGTQTQFVQADLSLKVTPYVSQKDCAIAMTLDVTNNQPDFVNTGARGDPTIQRKEAHTVMLVNDGDTTVLGGIYTRNSGLAFKKIPLLGDLPFIGWFFKNRTETDNRTELLVFITPKITNRALLRCTQ
jgi:type IV pilus assembly protein PilQ